MKEGQRQKINQAEYLQNLENITRRHFLWESASGLGALALGSLFGSCSPLDRKPFSFYQSTCREAASFYSQSKVSDLFAYGRCSFAIGNV
jgi:hypothetical protein